MTVLLVRVGEMVHAKADRGAAELFEVAAIVVPAARLINVRDTVLERPHAKRRFLARRQRRCFWAGSHRPQCRREGVICHYFTPPPNKYARAAAMALRA